MQWDNCHKLNSYIQFEQHQIHIRIIALDQTTVERYTFARDSVVGAYEGRHKLLNQSTVQASGSRRRCCCCLVVFFKVLTILLSVMIRLFSVETATQWMEKMRLAKQPQRLPLVTNVLVRHQRDVSPIVRVLQMIKPKWSYFSWIWTFHRTQQCYP